MTTLAVRDLMTTALKTLGRNDQLSLADDLMRAGRIRCPFSRSPDGHLRIDRGVVQPAPSPLRPSTTGPP
jgi:hypothetical protein